MLAQPIANSVQPTTLEVETYRRFVQEQAQHLLQGQMETPPPVLWHYTTGDALIGIVSSGELWATQVSCVNDQTELRYAQGLLFTALMNIKNDQQLSDDEQFLVTLGLERLAQERTNISEWFITCFSTKFDDLSQWRAYGLGEGGYSLGFNSSQLRERGERDLTYLVPVCYDAAIHEKVAMNVAKTSLSFCLDGLKARPGSREAWAEAFFVAWGDAITYLAPVIKHPSFREEQEWRLVRRLRDPDFSRLVFRQKQTLLARHLRLWFPVFDVPRALLPLTKIYVGPSRNGKVSRISIADLLRANFYHPGSVDIVEASVPFQQV